MADDKALFTHHLEMVNHHIQQMMQLHGDSGEVDEAGGMSMDNEMGEGPPKATPFAGKETIAEEGAEDHAIAKKGRRR